MDKIEYNFHLAVIGGAGPLIANKFTNDVLRGWQRRTGARADDEFPSILSWNKAWPGVDGKGVSNQEAAEAYLRQARAALERLGAKQFIIPCLSAYDLAGSQARLDGQEGGKMAGIDWLGWFIGILKTESVTTVGILSSESTKNQGHLAQRLEEAGIQVQLTDARQQAVVNQLIEQGMTGQFDRSHLPAIKQLERELLERNEMLWWGCTELSFIPRDILREQSIQSLPIMVEACLEAMLPKPV